MAYSQSKQLNAQWWQSLPPQMHGSCLPANVWLSSHGGRQKRSMSGSQGVWGKHEWHFCKDLRECLPRLSWKDTNYPRPCHGIYSLSVYNSHSFILLPEINKMRIIKQVGFLFSGLCILPRISCYKIKGFNLKVYFSKCISCALSFQVKSTFRV